MEKLQVISHPQFGNLSFIMIDGRELFKAKECAIMLGYKDAINAIKQHCKGVVKHHLPTTSGKQTVNLIPEGDLWRLIIRSKLPQAEQIEKWIMDEVLPSIRKTGTYNANHPQLNENPYEYADKFYKGKLVLTSIDIEHFSGINRTNIGHALRTKCEEHTDYKLLKGAELAEFKRNNPNFTRSVSCIFIVFKSGFDKLTEFFDISSIVKEIKYEYIDIANDPNFKAEIAEARNTLNTLSTLVSEFENNSQMEKSSFKSLSHTIRDFAFYHTHSLISMGTKDYVTITEYRK